MERTEYLPGGERKHPLGLALVIGGHVAVLGAIILSPPEFVRDPITHLIGYNVPINPPPPENPPPPNKKREARQKSVIDTPTPAVDPRRDPVAVVEPPIDPPPLPPADPPFVPPTPQPVFAEAQIDPRGAFQPDYPPAMARQSIDGVAVVRVLIGADGRVKAVQMVSASDPAFYAATERQALRHWRFRAATRDGVAVESWRTMTVRFRMEA